MEAHAHKIGIVVVPSRTTEKIQIQEQSHDEMPSHAKGVVQQSNLAALKWRCQIAYLEGRASYGANLARGI